jgi:hypothetical protein
MEIVVCTTIISSDLLVPTPGKSEELLVWHLRWFFHGTFMIRMVSPTQLPNLHHVSCIHCLHAFLVHFKLEGTKLKICTSLDINLLLFPEPFNKTTTYGSLACLYLAPCTDLDSLQAGTDSIMNVKSHILPCHLYLGSCPNICGHSGPILGPQLSLLSDYYLHTCALVWVPETKSHLFDYTWANQTIDHICFYLFFIYLIYLIYKICLPTTMNVK